MTTRDIQAQVQDLYGVEISPTFISNITEAVMEEVQKTADSAMESPRLWSFANRLKLLGIVTLVYAFLLHLLSPTYSHLLSLVLQLKCHRTGKRCRDVIAPLNRLRWAISRLWDDYHPMLGSLFPPHVETIRVLASFRC